MRKIFQQREGFTLVELLVVISIILMIAGMSIPAMSGFMEKRKLKSAGSLIQMLCIESRARAIAQREKQYIVIYGADGNCTLESGKVKSGKKGWVFSYDSNENGDKDYAQVDQGDELPQFTHFTTPATNLKLTFNIDGTIMFNDKDDDDVVVKQKGTDLICRINILPNTGKVSFKIERE